MPASRFATFLSLFVVFALAACSSQPAPAPDATPIVIQATIFGTPTPAPTLPPTPTPVPTSTPVPPQPIAVEMVGSVDTLHPFLATSDAARTVLAALFVGCAGEDAQRSAVALGCEQVPTAENGGARFVGEGLDRYLEVTFKIRPDWRWTDGRPVVAQDAVYAWQLAMAPEFGLRDPLAQSVYAMTAVDDKTLRVAFMSAAQAQAAAAGALRGDVPFEYFSQLGDYATYAGRETPLAPASYWAVARWLPSHLLRDVPPAEQRASSFAQRPIGDGPFELAEVSADRIALEPAAPDFPLGEPAPVGIAFVLGGRAPEGAPRVAAVPEAIPSAEVDAARWYTSSVEQLVFNVDRFPFDDPRVRQAVAHALQRGAMGQDAATTSAAPFALDFDPARAAELLSEAGWQCDAKPCVKAIADDAGDVVTRTLAFKLVTTEREPRNVVAQAIQKQLAEAGFAVDVEIVFGRGRDSRMFAPYERGGILLTRDFDAALYQIAAPAPVAGQFACARVPTEERRDPSQGNASGYCDPEVDALLAQSEDGEAVIGAGRGEALAQAMARIAQAAPAIPLYEVRRPVVVSGVSGVDPAAHLPITWNIWQWRAAP